MTKLNIFSALLAAIALSFTATSTGCADVDADAIDSEGSDLSGRPSFDVFQGADSRYYFNFSAANHQIILASQSYSSRTGAIGGALSVMDNGGDELAYDLRPANNGGFYFNLKAGNGQIIATSEVYSTKSNATRGIATVTRNIGDYLSFSNARTGARFVVFEGESESYSFQLRAKNGRVVLKSETYKSEASALNGTFSVAENGITEANYEVLEAASGEYYFNLIARNGEIIGTSEMYSTKSNATRGMRGIVELLPVVDLM